MIKLLALFTLIFSSLAVAIDSQAEPVAEKSPTKLEAHGDIRFDNYFWMKQKESEKVLSYLKEENAYTEAQLKDTKALQETLYEEMKKRIKEDDQSVPYKMGDYFYYTKIKKGQEYSVHCRKKGSMDAEEEVLLDANQLAVGVDSLQLGEIEIHPNDMLAAYGVDNKGDRVYTIYFKDLKTGKLLSQKIEDVTDNYVWAESGNILFYAKHDPETLRSDKIYRYDLDKNKSELIYTEKDEKFDVGIAKSSDGEFLFLSSTSPLSSEVRFIRAHKPLEKWNMFLPREKNLKYDILSGGDRFYIYTNYKAQNFRLMETSLKDFQKKNWREVIPHRQDVFMEGVDVFKNHIVVSERTNALPQLFIYLRDKKVGDYVKFPDPAYVVSLGDNPEYDTTTVRYQFESLNRPPSVFDYNILSKNSIKLKEREVDGFNSSDYISERIYANANTDGVKIPVTVVYKKGFIKNGSAPMVLYSYGSYGDSVEPYFDSKVLSLLNRGFIYAIAHVRGGSEMGRRWYEDGKFLKKKNTFTDFISVAEFLAKEQYAHPKKMFAWGESAGGLLIGAVLNLRPNLFLGVTAKVPFVDVVTTMLDSTLPLTTGEYEEWGNPNDKKYYDYMKSYSPYDNVGALNYPHMLVTTGLNDSQVSYWEPTKWVAKIRDSRLDPSKLLLLKIEMDAGHGGRSGRFHYLKEEALTYAFFLKCL